MRIPTRVCMWIALCGGVFLFLTTALWGQDHDGAIFRAGGETQSRNASQRTVRRAMAEQYLAASMPWSGARVNEYVNRLGQNLARASGSPELFSFRVVYSPLMNARAFPGGYVFVNSGVIGMAESEAELAAVLAHEIAHVNARHWQRQKRRRQLTELLVVSPLAFGLGPIAMGASYGNALLTPVAEARFSRGFEQEADALAAVYLARAGYDPEAASHLLDLLAAWQARVGTDAGNPLSTHPSAAHRRRHLQKALDRLARPALVLDNTSEFESVREEIRAYDAAYFAATGDALPGAEPAPPKLSRRPALP